MNEMLDLAINLNIKVPLKRITKIKKINPATLIGSGLINEISLL